MAGGTCDTCSDKDTCTSVTCATNKHNNDNNLDNGCEAGPAQASDCPTSTGLGSMVTYLELRLCKGVPADGWTDINVLNPPLPSNEITAIVTKAQESAASYQGSDPVVQAKHVIDGAMNALITLMPGSTSRRARITGIIAASCAFHVVTHHTVGSDLGSSTYFANLLQEISQTIAIRVTTQKLTVSLNVATHAEIDSMTTLFAIEYLCKISYGTVTALDKVLYGWGTGFIFGLSTFTQTEWTMERFTESCRKVGYALSTSVIFTNIQLVEVSNWQFRFVEIWLQNIVKSTALPAFVSTEQHLGHLLSACAGGFVEGFSHESHSYESFYQGWTAVYLKQSSVGVARALMFATRHAIVRSEITVTTMNTFHYWISVYYFEIISTCSYPTFIVERSELNLILDAHGKGLMSGLIRSEYATVVTGWTLNYLTLSMTHIGKGLVYGSKRIVLRTQIPYSVEHMSILYAHITESVMHFITVADYTSLSFVTTQTHLNTLVSACGGGFIDGIPRDASGITGWTVRDYRLCLKKVVLSISSVGTSITTRSSAPTFVDNDVAMVIESVVTRIITIIGTWTTSSTFTTTGTDLQHIISHVTEGLILGCGGMPVERRIGTVTFREYFTKRISTYIIKHVYIFVRTGGGFPSVSDPSIFVQNIVDVAVRTTCTSPELAGDTGVVTSKQNVLDYVEYVFGDISPACGGWPSSYHTHYDTVFAGVSNTYSTSTINYVIETSTYFTSTDLTTLFVCGMRGQLKGLANLGTDVSVFQQYYTGCNTYWMNSIESIDAFKDSSIQTTLRTTIDSMLVTVTTYYTNTYSYISSVHDAAYWQQAAKDNQAKVLRYMSGFASWAADLCSGTAASSYCGDGYLQCGEPCDDGNNIDGDGCSRFCEVEYTCSSMGQTSCSKVGSVYQASAAQPPTNMGQVKIHPGSQGVFGLEVGRPVAMDLFFGGDLVADHKALVLTEKAGNAIYPGFQLWEFDVEAEYDGSGTTHIKLNNGAVLRGTFESEVISDVLVVPGTRTRYTEILLLSQTNCVVYAIKYDHVQNAWPTTQEKYDREIFAGTFGDCGFADGVKNFGKLNHPTDLMLLSENTVLIADRDNKCIRTLDASTGAVGHFSGVCQASGSPLDTDNAAPDSGLRTDSNSGGDIRYYRPYKLAMDPTEQFIAVLEYNECNNCNGITPSQNHRYEQFAVSVLMVNNLCTSTQQTVDQHGNILDTQCVAYRPQGGMYHRIYEAIPGPNTGRWPSFQGGYTFHNPRERAPHMGFVFDAAGALYWTSQRPSCSVHSGTCNEASRQVRLYKLSNIFLSNSVTEIPLSPVGINGATAPNLIGKRESSNLFMMPDSTLLILLSSPETGQTSHILNVDVGKPAGGRNYFGTGKISNSVDPDLGAFKCTGPKAISQCMCKKGWGKSNSGSKTSCDFYGVHEFLSSRL